MSKSSVSESGRPRQNENHLSPFSVEEVKTVEGFEAVREEWDDLVERASMPHLSSSFTYAFAWWKNRNHGNRLHILLIREGRRLAGIAPLMISDVVWRMFKATKASFMLPRYLECDFITEPRDRRECIGAVIEHLLRTIHCDYIEFCGIPQGSCTLAFLRELTKEKGMNFSRRIHSSGCYLRMEGTWDSFMKAKSQSFRKSVRYYEKSMRSRGELKSIRVQRTSEPSEIMKSLLLVDRSSWKVKWIAKPENSGLISDLLTVCNEKGWLDLFIEEIDGHPIAYLFMIHYKGKAYAMFTSYSLELEADSPGLVVFAHALKQLFQEGIDSEVDFLSSFDYLRRWTRQLRFRYLVTLYPPGASGKALRLYRGVLSKARSSLARRAVPPRS